MNTRGRCGGLLDSHLLKYIGVVFASCEPQSLGWASSLAWASSAGCWFPVAVSPHPAHGRCPAAGRGKGNALGLQRVYLIALGSNLIFASCWEHTVR